MPNVLPFNWVERHDEAISRLSIPQRPVSWRGGALIFGYQPDNDGIFDLAVWISSDGLTWEVQPLTESPAPSGNGIVSFSGGLFSAFVGTDEFGNTSQGVTWTSVDGLSWEVYEGPPDEFPAPGETGDINPATSFGDGVLVVTDAIWAWYPGF